MVQDCLLEEAVQQRQVLEVLSDLDLEQVSKAKSVEESKYPPGTRPRPCLPPSPTDGQITWACTFVYWQSHCWFTEASPTHTLVPPLSNGCHLGSEDLSGESSLLVRMAVSD